jgi:hypothetical protein
MISVTYVHACVAAAVTGIITINPSSFTRLLRWKQVASHAVKKCRHGCDAVVLKMVFSFMVHSMVPVLLQGIVRLF